MFGSEHTPTQGLFQDSFVRKKYTWISLSECNSHPTWRNSPSSVRASSLSRVHDYIHTQTHTHSLGPLWTSHQPEAQSSTWQHTTLTPDKTSMPHMGFEPAISGKERPPGWAWVQIKNHRSASGSVQRCYVRGFVRLVQVANKKERYIPLCLQCKIKNIDDSFQFRLLCLTKWVHTSVYNYAAVGALRKTLQRKILRRIYSF
jgi:hypothetical protein